MNILQKFAHHIDGEVYDEIKVRSANGDGYSLKVTISPAYTAQDSKANKDGQYLRYASIERNFFSGSDWQNYVAMTKAEFSKQVLRISEMLNSQFQEGFENSGFIIKNDIQKIFDNYVVNNGSEEDADTAFYIDLKYVSIDAFPEHYILKKYKDFKENNYKTSTNDVLHSFVSKLISNDFGNWRVDRGEASKYQIDLHINLLPKAVNNSGEIKTIREGYFKRSDWRRFVSIPFISVQKLADRWNNDFYDDLSHSDSFSEFKYQMRSKLRKEAELLYERHAIDQEIYNEIDDVFINIDIVKKTFFSEENLLFMKQEEKKNRK